MKETIMYFFVLGFVVFGLHSFFNNSLGNKAIDPLTVEVTSSDIEWVRSSWEARMKRPPTQSELEGLINKYIKDEIFSREALALGLDEKDNIIKQHLVRKLSFVLEDLAEAVEPTEA